MTLAASRRYYPGFFAALFLVLLRTAIGWHFLTEGLGKLKPSPGEPPFSAETYLRNSTGPLAGWFRSQVPDVDSLEVLARDPSGRPENLKARWRAEFDRLVPHYHLTDEQRAKAEEALKQADQQADAWFADLGNTQNIEKYRADIERLKAKERSTSLLRHERTKYYEDRRALEEVRKGLVAPLNGWTQSLYTSWSQLLTDEQRETYGKPPEPWTSLDRINATTAWVLTLGGAGLLLGLLTPISALAGATLLALFYLSMPPWPGLPVPPNAEGHYWIVNKNMVEFFACLVVASTPNGLWIGLDALLFGWIGRRRGASSAPRSAEGAEPPGSNPAVNGPERDRPRGSADSHKPVTATRSQ